MRVLDTTFEYYNHITYKNILCHLIFNQNIIVVTFFLIRIVSAVIHSIFGCMHFSVLFQLILLNVARK